MTRSHRRHCNPNTPVQIIVLVENDKKKIEEQKSKTKQGKKIQTQKTKKQQNSHSCKMSRILY
jgi:hypothetical protein